MPRGPRGVPLRRDGPDLFQAQGIRLRLGADPAAASSLLPQLELFLGLLGEGAPRPLGEQRRPGPDLDAAREPAAVRDTVLGDSHVPGDDSRDGPFGVFAAAPVLLEQERRGGESRQDFDAGLLRFLPQVSHQLSQRKHPALALFVAHLRRRREPPARLFGKVEEAVGADGDARGGAGVGVGRGPVFAEELDEGARVDRGSGESVCSDSSALLEDGDGEIDVRGGGALLFFWGVGEAT